MGSWHKRNIDFVLLQKSGCMALIFPSKLVPKMMLAYDLFYRVENSVQLTSVLESANQQKSQIAQTEEYTSAASIFQDV